MATLNPADEALRLPEAIGQILLAHTRSFPRGNERFHDHSIGVGEDRLWHEAPRQPELGVELHADFTYALFAYRQRSCS